MNRIILLNSVYTKKRRVPYWNQIGGQANGGVVRSIHGKSITRWQLSALSTIPNLTGTFVQRKLKQTQDVKKRKTISIYLCGWRKGASKNCFLSPPNLNAWGL
jgi:hypothetical protein